MRECNDGKCIFIAEYVGEEVCGNADSNHVQSQCQKCQYFIETTHMNGDNIRFHRQGGRQ